MPSDSAEKTNILKEHWQMLALLCLTAVVMIVVLATYLPALNDYAAWCAEQGGELVTYVQSPVCEIPE